MMGKSECSTYLVMLSAVFAELIVIDQTFLRNQELFGRFSFDWVCGDLNSFGNHKYIILSHTFFALMPELNHHGTIGIC